MYCSYFSSLVVLWSVLFVLLTTFKNFKYERKMQNALVGPELAPAARFHGHNNENVFPIRCEEYLD